MLRPVVFAAAFIVAAPAMAFDQDFRSEFRYQPPEGWRTDVLDGIKAVSSKVTDTMWGQSISLWVEVKNDGTDWETAGRSFCLTLAGAGKPADQSVTISVWQAGEIVAKIPCD